MSDNLSFLRPAIDETVPTVAPDEDRHIRGNRAQSRPASKGSAEYEELKRRQAELVEHGIDNPYFLLRKGIGKDLIETDGSTLINFASYNYLGLAGHPEVSAAAKRAIDEYGTSVSASRIVTGNIPLHLELKRKLADFLGTEDCLVFISGYNTNVTTIGHLFRRKDLLIHDEFAHNSIISGCQLSHARRMSFPHNDMDALERLLEAQRPRFDNVGLFIEGLYSMEGDTPDLARLGELRSRFGATVMVDEAHSLGVIGETGRGIAELCGIERGDVDIWMGTLSKALASCGGYVAGGKSLVEYLRYSAPGFIYSVGMSPPDTAAAITALDILEREPERIATLRENGELFGRLAAERGLETGSSERTPIVPVIIGDSVRCLALSQRLRARGVHVQPIVFPAVAETAARLRFFVTSMHSEAQIRLTVEILASELAGSAS